MSKTVVLEIDITDWVDEYQREEANLSTEETALALAIERGYSPQQMGRMLPVAWHRQESEFAPPPKPMMMAGYARDWSTRLVNMMEKVELGNGMTIRVRSIVGSVPEPEPFGDGDDGQPSLDLDIEAIPSEPPDDNRLKRWDDPMAIQRAHKYLQERVPGYVYGRLKIIAANDGDVWTEIRELQDKLEELGERLS